MTEIIIAVLVAMIVCALITSRRTLVTLDNMK